MGWFGELYQAMKNANEELAEEAFRRNYCSCCGVEVTGDTQYRYHRLETLIVLCRACREEWVAYQKLKPHIGFFEMWL